MTAPLDLKLAAVHVRFESDRAELTEYARAHLEPLLLEAPSAAPEITAKLHWIEGHPPPDPASTYAGIRGWDRVDRDLYGTPGQLVWLRLDELRDLHLHFRWDGRRLEVEGRFYHRLSNTPSADRLRRLVFHRQLDGLRRKRFTRLLYYLVYYPAFWWMEHMEQAHPLHAGAVDTPAGALVLAGPSGVGKSTLTVALAASPGARLMSDTFVLHRGSEIWAVPEPLLLDAWSRQWLGEAAQSLQLVEHPYMLSRRGYLAPRAALATRAEAAAVLLPHRAPQPFVRRLEAAEAAARIDAYDDIVNDLRRYRAVAAVLEMLGPAGLARSRLAGLDQLTAAAACYEVGLTSAMSRAEAVDMILNQCDAGNGHRPRTAARTHA